MYCRRQMQAWGAGGGGRGGGGGDVLLCMLILLYCHLFAQATMINSMCMPICFYMPAQKTYTMQRILDLLHGIRAHAVVLSARAGTPIHVQAYMP